MFCSKVVHLVFSKLQPDAAVVTFHHQQDYLEFNREHAGVSGSALLERTHLCSAGKSHLQNAIE